MSNRLELSDNLKESNGELLIIVATLPLYFFFPVATMLIWILYHCRFKKYKLLTILLISITFGLVASTTKAISVEMTDIERYKSSYLKLANASSYLEVLIHSVLTSGEINVIFISINYFFSWLFPGYFPILPLFWVSITYFFTLLTFFQYSKVKNFTKGEYSFYFVAVVLLGIPFYQTTETIKQCSSIAIMGYSLVLKSQEKKSSLIWLIISLMVHLSGLFLVPIFFLLKNKKVVKYFLPLFLIAFIISFVNINDLFTNLLGDYLGAGFKDRALLYADYSWSLSRRYYVILFLYGLICLFLLINYNNQKSTSTNLELYSRLLNLNLLAFLFLLINRSNVHNFVRYTLTYFPFYILSTLQVLDVFMPKKQKIFVWLFLVVFFAYSNYMLLMLRTDKEIGYANSYMDNSISDVITSSWVDYLRFK